MVKIVQENKHNFTSALLSLAVNWGAFRIVCIIYKVNTWGRQMVRAVKNVRVAQNSSWPASSGPTCIRTWAINPNAGFPSAAPACSSSWHNSSPGSTLLWRQPQPCAFLCVLAGRRVGRGWGCSRITSWFPLAYLFWGMGGLAHVGRHMRKINDAIGQAD